KLLDRFDWQTRTVHAADRMRTVHVPAFGQPTCWTGPAERVFRWSAAAIVRTLRLAEFTRPAGDVAQVGAVAHAAEDQFGGRGGEDRLLLVGAVPRAQLGEALRRPHGDDATATAF